MIPLPEFAKRVISENDWSKWSKVQQDFVIAEHGKTISKGSLDYLSLRADYSGKTWAFGLSRKDVGEVCDICNFKYCFYAFPRNWAMGSDSDVWNLMRCANVECGHYFESCL